MAKPSTGQYQRRLPHFQAEDKALFVTFCTVPVSPTRNWCLPETVRTPVLQHCLHDHGTKILVHGAVVMPDHVHLVFTPLVDSDGNVFGLPEIMNGIKGASSHTVNRLLKRKGHVWQDESYDHVLRSDESAVQKAQYICENPVRRGLVKEPDAYPWLWREWVEGAK